ncbi:MAG TPA: lipoyl(octanoyl) transferase LipB [Solirubrobacteraceae bacterium]|nr:lipoyl(octanoyl) transferase LipB [Solirubrobacteraceae bacterium]
MQIADGAQPELWVCHLGVVPYGGAVGIQERLRERRQSGELPDVLLLLEHPPTYTRGRRAGAGELPFPEAFYAAKGIEVRDTDRGGRVTYHAPGQLVGYPIMAVADVIGHVRTMERAIVSALSQVGLAARARPEDGPDYTGVWVGERKIASIGVHVARGVSTHGFAVNVENDLEPFTWVVACGLPDVAMTSLRAESGGTCESLHCFRSRMAYSFCQAHGRRQRLIAPARLGLDTTIASPIKTPSSPLVEPVPA